VDPSGRTGELDIAVEADAMGVAVGQGSGSAMIGDTTATVLVDTVDFVVNTETALDQFLSLNNPEANGLQLGVDTNGIWTVGFRDNCNGGSACNVNGRRFDPKAQPQQTAAGSAQFLLSTELTDDPMHSLTAAVSASGTTTVAVWNFQEITGSPATSGVACRSLDMNGSPGSAGQQQLSSGSAAANAVSVASLSNSFFALAWDLGAVIPPNTGIFSVIASAPNCIPETPPGVFQVSTTLGVLTGPASPHVAANRNMVMYAWITDGNVYVRPGTFTGPGGSGDTELLMKSTSYQAYSVRLAPLGSGFALVVRWVNPSSAAGPGKIELFQLAPDASPITQPPVLITDRSLSDPASGQQAIGVAARASDGEILVVWHACDAMGTMGSCRVYGQQVSASGALVGGNFILSTTQTGDQTAPAVVGLDPTADAPEAAFATAWNDTSETPPDTSGKAVRARIIYPDSGSGM
jgi:hypothetical protein